MKKYLVLFIVCVLFSCAKEATKVNTPEPLLMVSKTSPFEESLDLLRLKWEYAIKFKKGELTKEEIKTLDTNIYQRRKELEKEISKDMISILKDEELKIIQQYSPIWKGVDNELIVHN